MSEAHTHRANAMARLNAMRLQGKLMDAVVRCQGREWKVHRNVLCSTSEWFEAAFKDCYKEGQESTIDFPEDDPRQIDAILEYLYMGSYQGLETGSNYLAWSDAFIFHAQLSRTAEKYMLDELKKMAIRNFKDNVCSNDIGFDHVAALFKALRGKDSDSYDPEIQRHFARTAGFLFEQEKDQEDPDNTKLATKFLSAVGGTYDPQLLKFLMDVGRHLGGKQYHCPNAATGCTRVFRYPGGIRYTSKPSPWECFGCKGKFNLTGTEWEQHESKAVFGFEDLPP